LTRTLSGFVFLLTAALLAGCAAPPRSTRMASADFDQMAAAMAQSLNGAQRIKERGPDSEPWAIVVDRVRNLTTDVMTPAEQWAIMHRIQDSQPMQRLWDEKRIRFLLPAAKIKTLRQRGVAGVESVASDRPQPTHSLTAVFRSAMRAEPRARTDMYYCQFSLMDLRSGQAVWADRVAFKRQARGHIWD
jgi:hypothetical protein